MKLLTVADGFGDNWVGPPWYSDYFKWPRIIELMTRGVEIENQSRYGAGNEYITQCVQNHYKDKAHVIVQWAIPNRLDLWLSHDFLATKKFWHQQINRDPVYHENILTVNEDPVWLSSTSKNKFVQEYHSKYISLKQHQLRSQLFINYVKLLLNQHNIPYTFMLTPDSNYLQSNDTSNWCWHQEWKGMTSFRYQSKYADLDFGYIQPIPLIHFDFVKQYLMPIIDLPWRSTREIDAVESMLYRKYKTAMSNKSDDTN